MDWLRGKKPMNQIPLSFCYAVLSGGKSSRMGRDKSLLSVDGQSIIERVVTDIQSFVTGQDQLYLCSGEKRYDQLVDKPLNYLDDYLADYQGPLSGLAAVFQAIKLNPQLAYQWVFTFPTDTLLLPSETYDVLQKAIEQNPSAEMVYLGGGRDHPLHAAYRIDLAEALFDYLAEGHRAVMKFIQQRDCRVVEIPSDWQEYLNFNTEDGFVKAVEAYNQSN